MGKEHFRIFGTCPYNRLWIPLHGIPGGCVSGSRIWLLFTLRREVIVQPSSLKGRMWNALCRKKRPAPRAGIWLKSYFRCGCLWRAWQLRTPRFCRGGFCDQTWWMMLFWGRLGRDGSRNWDGIGWNGMGVGGSRAGRGLGFSKCRWWPIYHIPALQCFCSHEGGSLKCPKTASGWRLFSLLSVGDETHETHVLFIGRHRSKLLLVSVFFFFLNTHLYIYIHVRVYISLFSKQKYRATPFFVLFGDSVFLKTLH